MNGRTDAVGCFMTVSVSPSHVNIPASCYQMSSFVEPLDQDVCSLGRVGLYDEEPQPFNGPLVVNLCICVIKLC